MDRLLNGSPSGGVVAKVCNTKIFPVQASGAQTASGNSSPIFSGDYKEGLLAINISAVTGTSPACQFALQVSDGTNWFNIPNVTISNQTAAGQVIVPVTNFGDQIRLAWTISGTTPSFTFSANFLAKS